MRIKPTKLIVFDVEGTIFKTTVRLPGTTIDSTIWQGIANALGSAAIEAEVATHRRWSGREYATYLEWVIDTIAIHKRHGLTADMFTTLIGAAEYNPNVQDFFRTLDRTVYEPVLVSGGFRELARRAQADLAIRHAFAACEYFFDASGTLSGYNLLPCDFEGKIDFIKLMLREYGLSDDDWVFIGDGANDVPIATIAPLSIAYAGHDSLKQVATFAIDDFCDLAPILANAHTVGQR